MTEPLARRFIAAVLVEYQGRYLFIEQDKPGGAYPGTLHIPGGGLEEGEDPESAARREVREEVGLELTDVKPAGFGWDTMPYKGQQTLLVFLRFTATATTDKVTIGDDATNAIWIARDDLQVIEHNAASQDFLGGLNLI